MTEFVQHAVAPRYHPGDVIAEKYRLVSLKGEGGMAGLWVAENMDLAAEVALKLIHTGCWDDEVHERLLSEARVMAQMHHPNIVQVFDYGRTPQGDSYIAMDLLRGESLRHFVAQGPMVPIEMVRTVLPLLDGLQFAHNHGVIHRDLKPDNVFVVSADGVIVPKLLDFGIAKRLGPQDFHLTRPNTIVGTPCYMSPEHAKGADDLDARSDIFMMCVLMYECLTGRVPFEGDNYHAILQAVIDAEPAPLSVFDIEEARLWAILRTGLAKQRADRWQSVRQLGEALALWLRDHGVEADISERSLRASWLPGLLVAEQTKAAAQAAPAQVTIRMRPRVALPGTPGKPIKLTALGFRRQRRPVTSRFAKRFAATSVGVGIALWIVVSSVRPQRSVPSVPSVSDAPRTPRTPLSVRGAFPTKKPRQAAPTPEREPETTWEMAPASVEPRRNRAQIEQPPKARPPPTDDQFDFGF